ncbi:MULTISPECIES: NYN domain-containing protein [Actinokineospora]|uniref:RNA-binding protein n=1 Tax=Actinokineospora fastidiosa TaxID=1816 RepID=A0A918LFP4_9PSEU|nr:MULTISPECIES: NYN domain-containing protein [Actinokineospora]UVS77855.1 putative RNA-binding protein containing a PIN domain protein [Actinokineospora sp. UTMC 2448]GGS40529.1 RNA-binding protein [Actinokineospora fastidiosa]
MAPPADPQASADPDAGVRGSTVDWTGLPEPVRGRLAEIAAEAVGALPAVDVPQSLRAVARFAPAKRARLGAGALIAALRDLPAFRTAVVNWAREHRPAALDVGGADPVAAAAAAVLLGEDSAVHYVELIGRRVTDSALRTERDAAVAKLRKAEAELARVQALLDDSAGAADRVRAESEAELERLRKRLREQGVKLREAKDAAAAADAEMARLRARVDAELAAVVEQRDRERERVEHERARAERAEADAEIARQSAREARQADEVRLALLVDTLDGAVTGLRRELALGGGGPRPADLVRGATAAQGVAGRVEDPAALDRLLALPSVHLVVDGYNVTKTGYPELSLADQRDRLVRQLAALAARTSAEVTLVFDGAGVVAVPVAAPRGVRVLFSDPGVLADDVIRALVTAEPEGRPVVVATSDRAVADSVRRRGAHPVPSAVLLARLGRI